MSSASFDAPPFYIAVIIYSQSDHEVVPPSIDRYYSLKMTISVKANVNWGDTLSMTLAIDPYC